MAKLMVQKKKHYPYSLIETNEKLANSILEFFL